MRARVLPQLDLDRTRTARVVIDLQYGIVAMQTEPHASSSVVANASALARAFRSRRMPVFLVWVTPSPVAGNMLTPVTDAPAAAPQRSANWADLVPELSVEPTDFVITKRQWGAFHGSELDLQLRRRGVKTIVLCGISTNIGVESTARFAVALGYQQVFVEDACAARSAREHEHTMSTILPRLGRIRSTAEVFGAHS